MKAYQHLTKTERRKIYGMQQSGRSLCYIASRLGRDRSTIYRELKRNKDKGTYLPDTAHEHYLRRRNRKPYKIKPDTALYSYIYKKLKAGWSPEQISGRMKLKAKPYYACHETIYQYMYKTREGKTWYQFLNRAKPRRGKRKGRKVGSGKFLYIKLIHDRPSEVLERGTFGHWEGDTMAFNTTKYENLTTLVERKSRYLILIKNENRQRDTVLGKIGHLIANQPKRRWKSLTLDQGSEFANSYRFEIQTKCPIYYCDPHSPWQRGTNENTNGRIRRFLSRDALITRISKTDIDSLSKKINNMPRKVLGFLTPKEAFRLYSKNHCCTSP